MKSKPSRRIEPAPARKVGGSRTCVVVAVIVIALGAIPVCGCGVMTVVFALSIKNATESDTNYQAAIERAEQNARVQESIGTPIKSHFFAGGSYEERNGQVDIRVPISGPNGRGILIVKNQKLNMERAGLTLEFDHGLVMRVEVGAETINLLANERANERGDQ